MLCPPVTQFMVPQREDKEEYKQVMKDRAATLYCPFEECCDHGKTEKGNIVFVRKYGEGATQNLFKCKTCGKTFSERRGTPLFNCKLKEETVYQIVKCICEGNGIRTTARIVGVNKDTVGPLIKRLGEHVDEITEYMVREYHLEECQLDELWTFIFKKTLI